MTKKRKIIALPILDNKHPYTFRHKMNTIKHFFNTKTDGEAILQAINFTLQNMTKTIPTIPTVNKLNKVNTVNSGTLVSQIERILKASADRHDGMLLLKEIKKHLSVEGLTDMSLALTLRKMGYKRYRTKKNNYWLAKLTSYSSTFI